jgi:hypothetical protein
MIQRSKKEYVAYDATYIFQVRIEMAFFRISLLWTFSTTNCLLYLSGRLTSLVQRVSLHQSASETQKCKGTQNHNSSEKMIITVATFVLLLLRMDANTINPVVMSDSP